MTRDKSPFASVSDHAGDGPERFGVDRAKARIATDARFVNARAGVSGRKIEIVCAAIGPQLILCADLEIDLTLRMDIASN